MKIVARTIVLKTLASQNVISLKADVTRREAAYSPAA